MLTGTVNTLRQARVAVTLKAPDGSLHEIETILDSGFNGSLTLPLEIVQKLALPWRTSSSIFLANGKEEELDVYAAHVIWSGVERLVLVEATGKTPLLGMALLEGHEVHFEVADGGAVSIKELRRQTS